ncbi:MULTISPECIES: 4-alpha-glucanotransferase [Cupriavidus]|uniref:4-alpha-glucanotransferase n=1 Tax=Cupriavidus pauculus TaxID=82633 RepID=A0A5P2HCP7_9BURK|nr:4-alpha-glucanotransferase [Cupriavidus pauculus]QET05951.1 4-alpha-glucanotransferase [Cupriavidus pauculus]
MTTHHTDPLAALATQAGLQTQWDDAWGQPQTLSPAAIRTVLTAMGLPCETDDQCEASRARLEAEDAAHGLPPLITADIDRPVHVPWREAIAQRPYRIEMEDGSVVEDVARRVEWTSAADTGLGRSGSVLALAPIATAGYHRLVLGDLHTTIAVAPPRCYGVEDALNEHGGGKPDAHPWGLAVQLYSLRRGAPTGLGDLTALADACEAAAKASAQAVAINPLHAGFAALPSRYSPYSPSSRLFFNPLYVDPAAVFGAEAVATAIDALSLAEAFRAAEARDEIDWLALSPARYAVLRWLWERQAQLLPADVLQRFSAFRALGGSALHAHACFEAMQQHRLQRDGEAGADWRNWPAEWRDPHDDAVAAFARDHADDVAFHTFLQWLAADGLAAAQRRARAAGMAIGVIADLAVGTDPGGSHAWTRQAEILNGFHAGAPPDVYNPLGQDWGVAVFSPRGLRQHGYAAFIEMLRANLAHAGGLRIDHVLGLARMWLVPEGASAREGAYLTYPLDDLLRLVALESWRHRAIVIGENLGTVPASLNAALAARGVLGIDVLWFERDAEPPAGTTARFVPAAEWPVQAVATTTTHDLPSIAGWWAGRDIAWRASLGQLGPGETEASAMAVRAADRAALWHALVEGGMIDGAARDLPPQEPPIEAILAWLGRTRTPLRLVPIEDLTGAVEQPNLPGTISGHPNWQRRIDVDVRALFARSDVAARVRALRSGDA